MKSYFKKKKSEEKSIAEERIKELFKQADEIFPKNKALANRYVKIARNISTRLKVRIPSDLKRRFCKQCMNYLKVGVNARIRLNKGKKTYLCINCGKISRVPYK